MVNQAFSSHHNSKNIPKNQCNPHQSLWSVLELLCRSAWYSTVFILLVISQCIVLVRLEWWQRVASVAEWHDSCFREATKPVSHVYLRVCLSQSSGAAWTTLPRPHVSSRSLTAPDLTTRPYLDLWHVWVPYGCDRSKICGPAGRHGHDTDQRGIRELNWWHYFLQNNSNGYIDNDYC